MTMLTKGYRKARYAAAMFVRSRQAPIRFEPPSSVHSRPSGGRRALLSYLTAPFRRGSHAHTAYFEVPVIAQSLYAAGYEVDVVDFFSVARLDYSRYELILGGGNPLVEYFRAGCTKPVRTIYYGGGMHVCHQNYWTLRRIREVHDKYGVYIPGSGRIVDKTWSEQTSLVDAMIVLGNEVAKDSYARYFSGPIYALPASYIPTQDGLALLAAKDIPEARSHYLWFGGPGLIHKGLDLVLDYFVEHPGLHLHVCANLVDEPEFVRLFCDKLHGRSNIHTHGFVDIRSELFARILSQCAFVISPSCSEGGSPAVLNCIGNGALIPILHPFSTLDTGHGIALDGFTVECVESAVAVSQKLSNSEIRAMALSNLEYVGAHHTLAGYRENMDRIIGDIVR